MFWQQNEVQLLQRNQRERVLSADTAAQLGRSQSAIRSKASDIGALQLFAWTRARDIRLEDLVEAKVPRKRIAEILGTTDGSVRQRMHRLGLRLT